MNYGKLLRLQGAEKFQELEAILGVLGNFQKFKEDFLVVHLSSDSP
ncbi:hypothetical protein LEP1GSC050_1968 [Leptospira broomii serovar Hurstbridge str. 5399]|uniref:Uncharacterized protein n=1 Tax=Leptospira broomii serovar Hurstbridge str. 5399 TaxID=1049789 RepID=T0GDY9_9LEPT|nr:hypothetical protein LEP1GSC050_1968 [Leptospira broomii serovar Hurstbridge str. 5399]